MDFTRRLPIGSRRLLTFHLTSLVSEEEFLGKDEGTWKNNFHNIVRPNLLEVSKYSKDKGVELKLETVPIPEAGDIPDDEIKYRGVKLAGLRNPFYLTHEWGFEQIRDVGLGICLDFCHSKTIYNLVKRGDPEKFLHQKDLKMLNEKSLFDDVKFLQKGDLVHLNDGRGIYSKKEGTAHEEGLALGKGEITDLRERVLYLDNNKIPFVIEVHEEDFNKRPNTRHSVDYILASKS